MAAGLVDLVDPPTPLTNEVALVPTVGHTPGHCSVVIESGGERAVITGDMTHHPIQLARPEIAALVDSDQEQSTKTRRAFVDEVCDTDTVVIGTHYGAPSGGLVRRVDGGVRFVALD
ncbi:MAG: MBL fold metallo-hydrolase [Acidimicrobiales bacterium]